MRLFLVLCALCLVNAKYTQAAEDDRITNLPGLPSNVTLPFNQFSGYLDVSSSKHIFYWFVESQHDPASAPIVLWTNGGPGCSGIIGFFEEHGPFRPMSDGSLALNPTSWNTIANMLYVEMPVGVGYSYSTNTSDYNIGDWMTAHDSYLAIKNFFVKYPQYKPNGFYLTAESYGGHYLPTLAKYIVDNDDGSLQFKGFLVGNPLTDMVENQKGHYDTFWGHQLVGKALYSQWFDQCHDGNVSTDACDNFENDMDLQANDIDPYALDFPVCTGNNAGIRSQRRALLSAMRKANPRKFRAYEQYEPCEAGFVEKYMNQPTVKQAIHAPSSVVWTECSNTVQYNMSDLNTPMEPIYQYLIKSRPDLRIWILSGDNDSVCGTLGTQSWIRNLGFVVSQEWKAWKLNGQVSGWTLQFYEGLILTTVHTAGHEVPAFQPERALHVFHSYLSGTVP
eukprot:TRINITY_DN1848_c0_g1_i1.p1 TRINITY_DN1848_c0_g1~~TRINITY_DN1848_c0_g1_i1.p1  ORF type:complete len:449 (-),score=58.50 TRINITY_DN1848_c0_g1_i1:1106-2452(-)